MSASLFISTIKYWFGGSYKVLRFSDLFIRIYSEKVKLRILENEDLIMVNTVLCNF